MKRGYVEVIQPGLGIFRAFGNVSYAYGGGGGLLVDCGFGDVGKDAVRALRRITPEPIRLIIYTHSHTDHTTGTPAFLQDAAEAGFPRPEIWSHEGVRVHQSDYSRMAGWHAMINAMQFDRPFEADDFRDPRIVPP